MNIVVLNEKNTILNQFISEIRDETVQRDSMRFRRNMERIGEIMAYEISKQLQYEEREVTTPLGIANVSVPCEKPVLATILRAGLPFHQGILNYFDTADSSFISAFRKYSKDNSFHIELEYISCPDLDNRTLILCDPMLATGASMVLALNSLLKKGKPRHTHIATIIACKDGINYIQKNLSIINVTLWAAAVDEELTVKSYIIPGLGDAGDLAYGNKENI
ncbi:MAG: uracil phosphoribosyltransferase [Bacteroidetes bacterium CG23_combo_of_CG06-09_8_20_14_all_32_9]|nr:MAG: uracil phosphoribosyltransferase [Bacteroidetes bacterium CG23_combo_of_CG06-09_8_20_14_all_32_9]